MRHTVLGFLCAATVFAYVQRTGLTGSTKAIEAELEFGPETMGVIMGAWYWVYALMQLPAGWVADRVGSRPALLAFAVAWSVLTAAAGLATGFTALLVLWGLMGAAQAGLFPCATKGIGATFAKGEQAFAAGGLAACMALGAAVSQVSSGRLLGPLTWQQILALYAVPGLIWAVAFAAVVPRWAEPAHKPAGAAGGWGKLVTDPQMLILCGQQFCRASAVALFYTWLPRYFQETHHVSKERAGDLAFWPLIVGVAGGMMGGIVSDKLLKWTNNPRVARQGLSGLAMVVCAGLGLVAYQVTDPDVVMALLCVIAFGAMASGVSGYSVAITYGGRRVATVFATMNMSGNIGAGLFPFVVGRLVRHTGDWNHALLVFAGLFAGSAACWAILNPVGTLYGDVDTTEETA